MTIDRQELAVKCQIDFLFVWVSENFAFVSISLLANNAEGQTRTPRL